MMNKTLLAVAVSLVSAGAAQAQSTCPCVANGTRTTNQAALVSLLSNHMVCASVGGEKWQEWHNGSTASGGPVVDYKLGPTDPKDPSATVGGYVIGADNTVSYTYGSSTYTYAVCSTPSSGYAFCGAAFGGRDITGAVIGGSGLQSCTGLSSAVVAPNRAR